MQADNRPDPDALLKAITAEEETRKRGKLRIFFGGCAGVGKTYAMLSAGHQLKEEGVDVVVGIVETHGRSDTVKLAEGLPQIPVKEIDHRGVILKEFDIDAAIARRPSLILIDELAHTNAPGSRHPKRWKDVEELIEEGIDVYTTLNVQHLESVNDIVASVTGIWVKETIPDTIFDKADDITLIDIPADELLKRLREGKVYIAQQAKNRAAQNFFKKSNLIALRELALRRTAERVDEQMAAYNTQTGVKTTQAPAEKIMVCIGPDPLSGRLVRTAKRLATGLKAPWIAVYVENHRHYKLSKKSQVSVERIMSLAESMGAETEVIQGTDAAFELVEYARKNNITKIVVGKSKKSKLRDFIFGSLANDIAAKTNEADVYVVTGEPALKEKKGKREKQTKEHEGLIGYIFALVTPIGCLALSRILEPFIGDINLAMIFLLGTVMVATRYGKWPSVISAVFSAFLFRFFFVEPLYQIGLEDSEFLIAATVMVITALVIWQKNNLLKLQVLYSRRREKNTALLHAITRELAITRGHRNMAEVASKHIGEAFDGVASVWIPDSNGFLRFLAGDDSFVDPKEEGAAKWAFEHRQSAGVGTNTLPSAKGRYIPMVGVNQAVGAIGVIAKQSDAEFSAEQENLLEAFSSLIAGALERATSAEEAEKSRLQIETEKLRNVLLSSVSHDLRTPLASINSAAAILLNSPEKFSTESERKELLRVVLDEASRLSKSVTNLLDVASLEAGQVKLNKQMFFIEEIIGSALVRCEKMLDPREIRTEIEEGLPLVSVDGLLIEQVIVNFLESIVKTSLPSSPITISAFVNRSEIAVSIMNKGAGLPKGIERAIFDNLKESPVALNQTSNASMAISRGIINAHGGKIWAIASEKGGAIFSFSLPLHKS